MNDEAAALLAKVVRIIVSLLPWTGVLYLHYWLEHDGVWAVDMPYRALISVLMLALGMALSFVLYSMLNHPRR